MNLQAFGLKVAKTEVCRYLSYSSLLTECCAAALRSCAHSRGVELIAHNLLVCPLNRHLRSWRSCWRKNGAKTDLNKRVIPLRKKAIGKTTAKKVKRETEIESADPSLRMLLFARDLLLL